MIMHTGSSWGFTSLLTLLPDMNIGIYSSMTGPDDDTLGRRTSHMYMMDLLLGEEPWLNLTTACTFPQPWYGGYKTSKGAKTAPSVNSDEEDIANSGGQTKRRRRRRTLSNRAKTRINGIKVTPMELSSYEGTYGNFGYGNITVVVNDNDTLELHYGELGLWTLEHVEGDAFYGHGQGRIWSLNIDDVQFRRSGDTINEVELSLESRDPPVFVRGLDMADAPPPPDPTDCSTGGGPVPPVSKASKKLMSVISVGLATLLSFLFV